MSGRATTRCTPYVRWASTPGTPASLARLGDFFDAHGQVHDRLAQGNDRSVSHVSRLPFSLANILYGSRIGNRNTIFPGAVIGAIPQDLKFRGEESTAEIGDNNLIRENVTIITYFSLFVP